jgi:hypothetical protein
MGLNPIAIFLPRCREFSTRDRVRNIAVMSASRVDSPRVRFAARPSLLRKEGENITTISPLSAAHEVVLFLFFLLTLFAKQRGSTHGVPSG